MSSPPIEPRLGLLGDSFIYACASTRSQACRHSVTLACALSAQPLTVSVGPRQWTGHLLAIRPFTARHMDSCGEPVALIDLEPPHPRYNTFSRPPGPQPVQVLDPERFSALLTCAKAFAVHALGGRRLQATVQLQVEDVADSIAPHQPLDRRVLQMMALLRLDPGLGLPAVATQVGLSASQASRTFVDALGLTVRQYALAAKIHRAALYFGSGRALTDIAQASGFTDSAHLAKVWTRCYGASPSHYFAGLRSTEGSHVDHAWRSEVRLGRAA